MSEEDALREAIIQSMFDQGFVMDFGDFVIDTIEEWRIYWEVKEAYARRARMGDINGYGR